MLNMIKVFFIFINGLVTGILLLISALGFMATVAFCEAARNSGLSSIVNRNGRWYFDKNKDEDKSVN